VAAIKTLTNRIDLLSRKVKKAGRIYFQAEGESLPPNVQPEDKIISWGDDAPGPKVSSVGRKSK